MPLMKPEGHPQARWIVLASLDGAGIERRHGVSNSDDQGVMLTGMN